MKRKGKIFIALLAVALLLCIAAVTLAACDPKEQSIVGHTGRYYEYNGGIKAPNLWVDIQADGWVDDAGLRGTYKLSGSAISLYCDGELLFEGTLENGVLTIYILGVPTKYYKDGFGPSSGSQTPTTPDEKPEEKPENTKCTVTYHANGGIFSGDNEIYSITVNKNSKLTAPTSPTRLNHTFFGWSKKSNSSDLWNFDTDTVESDLDLYAVWQQRSAVIFSVEGASIDGTDIFMLVDRNTTQVSLSNMIVCSNDSTWELYYDSLGQTKIPTKIAASKNGHLNDGANDFWIVVTSKDNVQTNVYQLTVYRSYAVPVNYMDGLSLLKAETAYTGYEYSLRYTPNIKGYKFNGWKIDGETATTVTPWGAVNVDVDKTANKYQVNFNENGGTLSSGDKAPVTVTYDDEFDFPIPSRTGYSFKGWEYDGKLLSDLGGNSLTGWDIAQSVTVKAKWEANQYKVTIKSDNVEMGTVSDEGDHEWDYDSTHTLTANTNEGCTFMGWYDNDKLLSRELNYQITVSTTNPTYTAKWYKIQIAPEDKSQGITVELNNTYIVGQEVYIEATPYLGYDFAGWYVDGKNLSQEEEYIYIMPENETKVIAKFSVVPEMANYTFTSSMTECNITGIVDTSVEEIIIPDYVTGVYSYAFDECDNVTSATIPAIATEALPKNNLTTVTITSGEIHKRAFFYCTSLQTVTIGEGVTSISTDAFHYCTGLTEITISDSVTSIDYRAFYGCTGLTEITIPDSVTGIDDDAFEGCYKLVHIRNLSGVQILSPAWIGEVLTTKDAEFQNKLERDDNGIWTYTVGDTVYAIRYDGESTDLDLPLNESIDAIYLYAFYNSRLTSVIIPDGVTSIGDYAFEGCTSLTEITIPDGVTSIGDYAFEGCTSLTEITIPDGVTSIGYYAFASCTGLQTANWNATNCKVRDYRYSIFAGDTQLTTVNIGDKVQTIPYWTFCDCTSLKTVTIGKSVTSIGIGAFSDCTSLETVNWNATNCTSAGHSPYAIFNGCIILNAVNIENDVQTIPGYAFYGCTGLTEITIPDSVTSIGGSAFSNCTGLQTVTIGDGVTSIGGSAFYNCTGLTEITIPDSVTSIGKYALYGCTGLSEISIPDSVTSIGESAFSGCKGLQTVNWNATNCTEVGSDSHYIFYGCTQLTTVKIGDNVQTIPDYAFYGCTGLTEITIPDSVTSIGYYAFYGCTGLQTVTIDEGVQSIGYNAFEGCTGIKVATMPALAIGYIPNKYSLTTVNITKGDIGGSAFSNCAGLQTVAIGDGVTSIGKSAFYNCTGLTEITIPDSVTSIGGSAFSNCTGLQTVNWNAINCTYNGSEYYVFTGCNKLTTINFDDNVQTIPASIFSKCTNITRVNYLGTLKGWCEIELGNASSNPLYVANATKVGKAKLYLKNVEVTGNVNIPLGTTKIGDHAFYGLTGLTSVTIPDSVESIGGSAFSNCAGLQTVTIGDGVTSIGKSAFYNCTGLKDIYYAGDKTPWENIEKGERWDQYWVQLDYYSGSYYTINYQLHYNSTGPEDESSASEAAAVILQNAVVDVDAPKEWAKEN